MIFPESCELRVVDSRSREACEEADNQREDSNIHHHYGPLFISVCLCVFPSSRSPIWRMILTGTQPNSTTGKALCRKTTSTCGHTRKYAHTHTHTRRHLMREAFHTSTYQTGLSKELISEDARWAALWAFSALLWTSALWHKAAYPKGAHSSANLCNHTWYSHVCVCVCLWVFTVKLLVHPVSPSDGHTPAGLLWQTLNWQHRQCSSSGSLMNPDLQPSWNRLVKSADTLWECHLGYAYLCYKRFPPPFSSTCRRIAIKKKNPRNLTVWS